MSDAGPDSSNSSGDDASSLLVASNRVDGIRLYSRDGEHLGSIYSLMLNKRTGAATYAVLALGGFLGMGKSYYPLPFELLTYDGANDHYVVTIDKRVLEGGPSWASNAPVFNQAYADRVANYYGRPTVNLTI